MDPHDVHVVVPCEGRCGLTLIIPFNIGAELFHANGTLKPEYREIVFLCKRCQEWLAHEDQGADAALQMLLSQPEDGA